MKKYFAVFGNPIKQSLSPQIHQLFAKQHQLEISYERIQSEDNLFKDAVTDFFNQGGNGCNVTAPFKEQAFEMCNQLSDSATKAQAVNTLYQTESGQLAGHNTDGSGLVHDLTVNLKLNLQGAKIIILGAGGATRGILQPLIEQAPSNITIINRTLSRAQTLAAEFSDSFSIDHVAADKIPTELSAPHLIINATSASQNSELPVSDKSLISKDTVCYDLAYAMEPTRFLQWAAENGCSRHHDGRGMLVEQAAHAFTEWTGLEVKTTSIIDNFEKLA